MNIVDSSLKNIEVIQLRGKKKSEKQTKKIQKYEKYKENSLTIVILT